MAAKSRSKTDISRIGFLRAHLLQAKQSFFSLWSRPLGNILTLAVIAMALTMPASLYLAGKNIAQIAENVASPSQLSVYLRDDTPEARIMVLKDKLERWPEVAAIEYISPQQGLSDLSQYSGFDDAIALLSDYSLPAVLILSPAVEQDSAIRQVASRIGQMDDIADVRMDEDWMVRLDAIRTLATTVAVILAVLMLGAVFLIVGNTLRFTVLAWILTAIITVLLNGAVEELARLYDSHFRLLGLNVDESFALLMLGAFLGFVAARFSTRRHLKEIEPV